MSKTTYCGDKKGLADKGETDVFIIKLKHLEDFVDLEPINTKNVITKNGQVIQKNRDNSLNRINMENYFISKHINEYGDEYDDQCLSDMLYSYFKKNNESE